MIYKIAQKILFQISAEKAHSFTMSMMGVLSALPFSKTIFQKLFKTEERSIEVCGLHFPNPVGLAAGFDKNGDYIDILANFGFGFIEVGTVTPLAQEGNPKPRLFRLPEDKALINRMGFNNKGVDHLVHQLQYRKRKDIIIGGNIGKNKDTPNDKAYEDYEICFTKLHPYVDYFVVNVSSPNTPNLRSLQEKEPLQYLLSRLMLLNTAYRQSKPIFLKIAPDLNEHQIDDVIDVVKSTQIAGLVMGNTTLSRSGLRTDTQSVETIGAGGLSGMPLNKRSTDLISYISKKTGGKLPIIGVGGIMSCQDAQEKISAGASLVQIYTGFIYQGPTLVKDIVKGLKLKD